MTTPTPDEFEEELETLVNIAGNSYETSAVKHIVRLSDAVDDLTFMVKENTKRITTLTHFLTSICDQRKENPDEPIPVVDVRSPPSMPSFEKKNVE